MLVAGDTGRLGQTMGTAELGRELRDAGGPLLVGAIATAVSLTAGYGVLALLLISVSTTAAHRSGRKASPTGPDNQVSK